jgi:hypothetical protein
MSAKVDIWETFHNGVFLAVDHRACNLIAHDAIFEYVKLFSESFTLGGGPMHVEGELLEIMGKINR